MAISEEQKVFEQIQWNIHALPAQDRAMVEAFALPIRKVLVHGEAHERGAMQLALALVCAEEAAQA